MAKRKEIAAEAKAALKKKVTIRETTMAEKIAIAAREETVKLALEIIKLNERIDNVIKAHEKCRSLKGL